MEEGSGPSTQTERTPLSVALTAEEMDEDCEPQKKKSRTEDLLSDFGNKLEHRLSGILCCTVCLDLPKTCFQVGFPIFSRGAYLLLLFGSNVCIVATSSIYTLHGQGVKAIRAVIDLSLFPIV